jgi:DNA-binding Lrp family transcriptional regulator
VIQGWQQDFPLHPSPFRQMAARSGATPRELLSTCRELQLSGALQPIRVRWGATLERKRWRLAFDVPATATRFTAALAALPGCFRVERAEAGAGVPTVWAEIEALDEAALRRQLARLPLAPVARLRLPSPGASLSCDDTRLAACVEQGLQVSSKPFAECAKRLGCSEHHVLSSLTAWRRTGQLEGLVLKPPPTPVPQLGLLALWRRIEPSADVLARLREQRGVDRVIEGPGSEDWPWQLSIVLRTTPQLGAAPWCERLAEAGLAAPPDLSVPLRIEQPRDQAMLFNTDS